MSYQISDHYIVVNKKQTIQVNIDFKNKSNQIATFESSFKINEGPSEFLKEFLKQTGFCHEAITSLSITELTKDISESVLNLKGNFKIRTNEKGRVTWVEQKISLNDLKDLITK